MWLYIRLPKKLVGLAKVAPKRPLKPSRPHKVPRSPPASLPTPCRRWGQVLECEAGHLSLASGRANLTSDR